MKIGFVSAILDDWDFDGVLDVAEKYGFDCIEVACWPHAKAERRYAGVSHIDTESLDDDAVRMIKEKLKKKGIAISALAYYPNPLDSDPEKRNATIVHLKSVIEAAEKLDVNLVTTFIGRDQTKNIEDNLKLVEEVWPPIINYAEKKGVKIAIENCPMLFGPEQWPGGQNLFCTPVLWRKILSILDSPNLGINYDPSHFIWQQMDYIRPIYEFRKKIFHVHFKDMKIKEDVLRETGILSYPLDYMSPKIPGLGDVDWGKFVSALTDIGYDGFACIEVEDRSFESSREAVLKSLELSKRYLSQYV